jgi:hypothetical protein
VGDGVDEDALTRAAYVDTRLRVYLPGVTRNYSDPYLYDDFNNPAYDGSYNPVKWQFEGNSAFQVKQQGGPLVFCGGNGLPAQQGAGVQLRQPGERGLEQIHRFEGTCKISSDHTGGYASAEIFIIADNIAGHNWRTQCMLGTSGGLQASFYCDVTTDPRGVYEVEYSTGTSASLDTWHVLRIETDPSTAELGFFLDGKLVGNYVPTDAADLVTANTFRPKVTVWNGDVNTRRHPFRRRRADHTGAVRVWIAKARRCTKHAKREEHEVAGRASWSSCFVPSRPFAISWSRRHPMRAGPWNSRRPALLGTGRCNEFASAGMGHIASQSSTEMPACQD